ncbi:MAG: sulfite exporter TauE/SafE family protein [Clostridia bacterium]|nr:sulfite exporter TauE/SafE family protein [Clostridia bacterium]
MYLLSDIAAVTAFSVLAGSGAGGGGLLVVYLTVLRGGDQIGSQFKNLASFVAASCAALPVHIRSRDIDPALLAVFVAGGIPGTFVGSRLRSALSAQVISKIFGVMLILGGGFVLFGVIKDAVSRAAGSRRE